MSTVRILLATYNGEKYIEEMVESILAHDYFFFFFIFMCSDLLAQKLTSTLWSSSSIRYRWSTLMATGKLGLKHSWEGNQESLKENFPL